MAWADIKPHADALRAAGYVAFRQKYSAPYLRSLAFEARTIVDVGVHSGTPPLYRAFSDRKFVLVEPLPGREEICRKHYPRLDFDYYECAAGEASGRLTFKLRSSRSVMSGLVSRNDDAPADSEELSVAVERLDEILQRERYAPPFGIKIDVEGFELPVLRGASAVLAETEFLIVESTIKHRFDKPDRFSDLVALCKQYDFELLDILNPTGRVNTYFDCLFVRSGSRLFS